ncbi:hypothetical protein C8J56DRAFT_1085233 [Mycena floridula]|nr:hypothetical protein C8J56DRAFT_1085233 [Mycena floridula]
MRQQQMQSTPMRRLIHELSLRAWVGLEHWILLFFHIQAKQSTDSLFALVAILLVRSIAMLYAGLDHEGFKKQVNIMGPLGFTLVNSVPGLITTVLVFRAVIIVSPSPAMVLLLVVITPIPLVVHLLCDAVALRLTNQGTENQVELGNIGDRVPAGPQAGVNLTQSRGRGLRSDKQRNPAETA